LTIEINFECTTIIGLLDIEREIAQKILVELSISYPYTPGEFIDYIKIKDFVCKKLKKEKYYLLEDAIINLAQSLKDTFKTITKVDIKLTKPTIINDGTVALKDSFIF